MKTKSSLLIALFAIMTMLSGCNSENEPTIKPDEKPDFNIEILSTTETSVSFRITPKDADMRYVAMMTTKSDFDEFNSDEAYIEDDIYYFESIINEQGKTAEEYYEEILKKGTTEDTQKNLSPETEYYLYAYGMTLQGEVTTKMYKMAFTTSAVTIEDIKFDVAVSDISYTEASITITPEDKKAVYFVNVFSDEDYEKWGGDENAYAKQLAYVREYYLSIGRTIEEIIANLCYAGDKVIPVQQLSADTHYTAYAIAVNSDFLAISKASTAEFSTLSAESKELTFECNITDIQYDRIAGTLTPSNNEDTYICSVQYADAADWYDTDEEFIESIVMDIDLWHGGVENSLHQGPTSLDSITGLSAETDYILVCFGYSGAATTGITTFPFTTAKASGDPKDLTVTFTIDELTHNSVKITTNPSVGAYYFVSYTDTGSFNEKVDELGTEDLAVAYFANNDIDYGAEFFECTRAEYLADLGATLGTHTHFFNQLTPSTEYIAFAIAVDMETGDLASTKGCVSEAFTTLEKVVSNAKIEFVFDKYYDGTALAELDPANYLNCTGKVVVPYTITANDDAMSWYTSIGEGDYTEWGCTDEDIYDELVTWGYEIGSELVQLDSEGGLAVLTYDTPFTFLGIAMDWEENFGPGTLTVKSFSRDGVSPAEEFLASQSSAKAMTLPAKSRR